MSARSIVGGCFLLVCTCLFFLQASSLLAKFPPQNIRFQTLGVLQGMSQNSALALVQDKQGFIWVGTYDGLNRYDGTGFTIFRHNNADSTSLPKNWITSLFEDKRGVLWVGTNGGGLAHYVAAKRSFRTFRHAVRDKHSLPSDEITTIAEDANGALWVGTNDGLCRFNAQTQVFMTFAEISPEKLPNEQIQTLYTDKQGFLWIGTRDGLVVYDVRQNKLQRISLNDYCAPSFKPAEKQGVQNQNLQSQNLQSQNLVNLIQVFLHDRFGTMWIGTRGGFFALNRTVQTPHPSLPLAFTGKHFSANPDNPRALTSDNVQSLLEDRDGCLWVGSKKGLHVFDRAAQAFARFRHDAADAYSLTEDFIMTILQDKSGVLWFGTSGGGLSKYDVLAHRFPLYTASSRATFPLSDKHCNTFCELPNGELWVGTENGITILNRANGTVRTLTQANTPLLGNNDIRAFAFDSKRGVLWVGTDDGINEIFLAKNKWKIYRNIPNNTQSLVNNHVITLTLGENGTLWAGTFEGASSYSPAENTWKQYPASPTNAASLSNNLVFGIVPVAGGKVWLGTDGGGLNLLDTRTDEVVEVFRHKREDAHSLSSDYILFLGKGANGEQLCIGTDGGVSIFNTRTKTFTNYTSADGLPNEIINAVLTDARGQYWVSTNKGISCMNPKSGIIRNFNVNDGLQSNEFNTGAALKGNDGMLYFGGIAGFNAFHPDSIPNNAYAPPVVFTGFRKFNQPARLDTAIEIAREITLPYSDNTITFEFAALSYTFPERNTYKYMLEGLDKAWIDAGSRHEATYTNLDGGAYTFRVKAANSDGVWNEEGATVRLVVVPPFWKALWFRVLISIGAILGIIGAARRRVRNVERRNQELERLVGERTAALSTSQKHLQEANNEITRQLEILGEQTVEIEMTNAELQEINMELEDSYSTVQKLSEMGQNITATLDEKRIFATAFQSFDELLGTSLFIIARYDDEAGKCAMLYVVEHGVLLKHNEVESPVVQDSIRLLEETGRTRQEQRFDDFDEYFREHGSMRCASDAEAMRSFVAMPLIVEDRLIAIVSVQSRLVNAYSAYHLDVIRVLASYTAIALDNARAYTVAQNLNTEKNMLLGVVAHDLKTPLSGVILATSNIEAYWERMNRDQILQRIGSIKQTSLNMVNFIEDLLDVSAIESGSTRLQTENIALDDIVRRCVEQQEQAEKKKITIINLLQSKDIRAFADYRRTMQVLDNLLSNALKFSPQGSTITLSAEVAENYILPVSEKQEVLRKVVVISIRDQGPGISNEDRKKLFGKFARLSAKPTAGEHSSGLGLAIVKNLVEAMHGRVWCESELDDGLSGGGLPGNGLPTGTTFFVALPVPIA